MESNFQRAFPSKIPVVCAADVNNWSHITTTRPTTTPHTHFVYFIPCIVMH
jgi:hypothetical protein